MVNLEKLHGAAVWSVVFARYQEWLESSPPRDFWISVRTLLDAQTVSWLQDCEFSILMDNGDEWNIKKEQLKSSVVPEPDGVHPGPEF